MKNIAEFSILIVDDTESSIDLLVAALEDNYDLAVALDGETALEIAVEGQPDLILLDIVMPGMDGFEVYKRLRANDETTSIPVMFLSGHADEEDRRQADALGAIGFIEKPFDVQVLRQQIDEFMRTKVGEQ